MKQLVFSSMHRLTLLKAFTLFSFQQETFDRVNNWANIISTIFYVLSQILFIQVLFTNVTTVAGYTRDQMLLFLLIGQLGYYFSWIIHSNLADLTKLVNTGQLDALLIRPVPSLFYVTFRKIRLFSIVRDALPPTILMILVIHWSALAFEWYSVVAGIIIFIFGLIILHCLYFLAVVTVFWLGESTSILTLVSEFDYLIGKVIPLEGFATSIRVILLTLVPILISAGLVTSVILGKSPILPSILLALVVTAVALFVRQYIWERALKSYTSASS